MSIWEFLQRLDADPFDPALTALFLDDKTAAGETEGEAVKSEKSQRRT